MAFFAVAAMPGAISAKEAIQPAGPTAIPETAFAEINHALVEEYLTPRFQALAEAAGALAKTTKEYCATGNGLDGVKARFHDVMDRWMVVEHLTFGPMELFMRSHRLYFWPDARNKTPAVIDELMARNDPAALTPRQFADDSIAAQGLGAVEYVLFSVLAGDTPEKKKRACPVLRAITHNIETIATGATHDWTQGSESFARLVTEAGPDNPYFPSHQDVAAIFLKSLYQEVQRIADLKLRPPLGEGVKTSRPALVESVLSERGGRNIALNLASLEALYTGGEKTPEKSLSFLVRTYGGDEKLDPLLRRAFDMTYRTVAAIEPPLATAVADPARRQKVETLLRQILALEQIVKTRLTAALGLQLGFNALDGD